MCVPSRWLISQRFCKLWIPVESINGTRRIRIMRTLGWRLKLVIRSSNLLAMPKKYGPLISYTSTPSGIMRCSSCTSASVSSFGSISSAITLICVVSAMRRMKSRQAMSRPTSMAIVRSKITVSRKVMMSTVMSLFGFFISWRNVRQPLMFTTRPPARRRGTPWEYRRRAASAARR